MNATRFRKRSATALCMIFALTACGGRVGGGDPIVVKDSKIDQGWIFTEVTLVVKNTGQSGTRYQYGLSNDSRTQTFCSGSGYLDGGEERTVSFDCSKMTQYNGKIGIFANAI